MKPKSNNSACGRRLNAKMAENLSGYLLIAPNLFGFLLFTLFGIVFSFAMAFTDWNLLRGYENAKFVGLKNFIDMFGDKYLRASLLNNAKLLIIVPVGLFLAAVLASLLNNAVYAKAGARALYFLPEILS